MILYNVNFILQRYEDQDPEDCDAILTKDFDKFDMILQAEYSSFNWFFLVIKAFILKLVGDF
jgi:hypothetical protein